MASNNEVKTTFTADSSGFTGAVDRASQSISAYAERTGRSKAVMDTFQRALEESGASTSRQVQQIAKAVTQMDRMAQTAGKTQAALAAMRAEQLGISSSVSGYVASLEQASKATHEFSLNNMSARRELLVLAHEASQGNWSRFAGSMGVLAERTDALSLVLSPLGLGLAAAAGAAALFAMEVAKGHEQIEAFNKAITATGGYVGLSAEQMAEMSQGLQTAGDNLSKVREAMAQVANTGAFTADNIQLATRAALAMSDDIGIGTDKAAESLARIQDNVLEWMSKYQAAHHAFSAAQVEEIDSLVKQGDTAAAVKAIMQDLAGAHQKIADDASKNMGTVLTWWHQWGDIIDRVKSSLLNIGVADSIDKQVGDQYAKVEAAQRNLKQAQSMGAMGNISSAQQELDIETHKLDVLRQQQTVINTQQRAREAAAKGGDSKVAVDSYLHSDKYASAGQKHSNELDDENKAFAKATANLDKNSKDYQDALKRHYENVQQINAEYAKKTRQHSGAGAFAGQIAAMTAANQVIEAEERRHEQTLKAARAAGLIDSEEYLRQLADIQTKAVGQEIANAEKRVDIAKGKPESAAYQEALASLQKLKDQRVAIETDLTEKLAALQQQRTRDVQRYSMQTQQPGQQQGASYAVQDATRYMGRDDATAYTEKYQLAQQYAQRVQTLWEQYQLDPSSDQKAYQQKLQAAQAAYDSQMQMLQTHLDNEQQIRNSYSDQMHGAITKLGGDGQTGAQAVATAFTTAWQDAASALDQFITTGKFNFDSFVAGILADMAKIAAHQAEMQIFQAIGGSMFSDGGAVGHFATGGAISGPGSGTSDSIPAMLSNGEFVVNAAATAQHRGLLESINSGQAAHFATGGYVGTGDTAAGSGAGSGGGDLHFHLDGNARGGLSAQDAKELLPVFQAIVDKRMDQRTRGQGGYAYQMRYGQI